jgi:hypothetical protein
MSGVLRNIDPPPAITARRVCTPAFSAGGGHNRWVERGWGVNISEDARHYSVHYICKYFVPTSKGPIKGNKRSASMEPVLAVRWGQVASLKCFF